MRRRQIYGGRFFADLSSIDSSRLVCGEREWYARRDGDLHDYWPREELPDTYMTHHANFALPKQGYTHWWKMFNARELLVHTDPEGYPHVVVWKWVSLERSSSGAWCLAAVSDGTMHVPFWDIQQDCSAPFFANPNYTQRILSLRTTFIDILGGKTGASCCQGHPGWSDLGTYPHGSCAD